MFGDVQDLHKASTFQPSSAAPVHMATAPDYTTVSMDGPSTHPGLEVVGPSQVVVSQDGQHPQAGTSWTIEPESPDIPVLFSTVREGGGQLQVRPLFAGEHHVRWRTQVVRWRRVAVATVAPTVPTQEGLQVPPPPTPMQTLRILNPLVVD